jgi:hypothetical protein
MSASVSPDLGEGVAEPFRSDPEFWRSVCASADAVVLLGLAVAGSALLGLAGVRLAWLPLVLPAIFLVRAAVASYRFHRANAPLPTVVDTARGELSWRDAERSAVAAVFGRALTRRRHLRTVFRGLERHRG